jgi:hypothetical protein
MAEERVAAEVPPASMRIVAICVLEVDPTGVLGAEYTGPSADANAEVKVMEARMAVDADRRVVDRKEESAAKSFMANAPMDAMS